MSKQNLRIAGSKYLHDKHIMPIALLMVEHRLIERMVRLLRDELHSAGEKKNLDVAFIGAAGEFLRAYADRCHHGKEEDILFSALSGKELSPEHKRTMDQLVEEHNLARETTRMLMDARERYANAGQGALGDALDCIQKLVEIYPGHIETEDRRFFIPVMGYFSGAEQERMLDEFWEFDRDFLHEKYVGIVEEWERKKQKTRKQA